jgi:hypothetical protein
LHDFSVVNNRLLWLLTLKDYFPELKVSLFTIPVDEKRGWGPYLIRGEFLKELKKNLDWIQLIPHGLTHEGHEVVKIDHAHFKHETVPAIERAFREDGLPFERGFCAPHWRWTEDIVKALDDLEWWGAIDRNMKMPRPARFYQYNYLLNEPFWESDLDLLKLHGHIYGTKNDVGKCFDNLLKLPADVEWCFVTDVLEENNAS